MGETSNSKWFYEYGDLVITIPEEDPEVVCCIYEVPKRIRQTKEEAYTPTLVSIGPFHYRNENLVEMEEQKLVYVKDFYGRTSKETMDTLVSFIENRQTCIRKCYAKSFSEFESLEFIKMIFCDAVFIIELFLKQWEHGGDYWRDDLRIDLLLLENQLPFFVLVELCKRASLQPFLTLASNYFDINCDSAFKEEIKHLTDLKRWDVVQNFQSQSVVEQGHPSRRGHPSSDSSNEDGPLEAIHQTNDPSSDSLSNPSPEFAMPIDDVPSYPWYDPWYDPWFTPLESVTNGPSIDRRSDPSNEPSELGTNDASISPPNDASNNPSEPMGNDPSSNLSRDPSNKSSEPVGNDPPSSPPSRPRSARWMDELNSATMLHEAGVKFKAEPNRNDLLNIKFEKKDDWLGAVLHIPQLTVHGNTEYQLRNIIALEQCHYQKKADVCAYILLMDHLIKTDKDVELLVKEGVLINRVGSATTIANMINNLLRGVQRVSRYFENTAENLIKFQDSSWNRTIANFKRVYFEDMLRGTLSVFVFFVALFSFIQTIMAILARVSP